MNTDIVMYRLLKSMFGDLCENFDFPSKFNPMPGEEVPTPSLFVNVKIATVGEGENEKIPTTFVIDKVLTNVLGFSPTGTLNEAGNSIRLKLKNVKDVNKLVNTKEIVLNNIKFTVKADPDKKLNQGRGTIYRKDMIDWTDEQIAESMKGYGVVDVYPFTRHIDNGQGGKQIQKTGRFKLTFATATVPREMKIANVVSIVNLYFDKPMYCQSCGQFGHTAKRCNLKEKICKHCSLGEHEESECKEERRCVNCLGDHDMNPRSCPVYKFEANCIRYATIEQVPVAAARKFALVKIRDHTVNALQKPNIAQIIAEDKIDQIDKPTDSWYRQKAKDTEKIQRKREATPLVVDTSYLATHMRRYNKESQKSDSVNSRLKTAAQKPNVNRQIVHYGDLMDDEDTSADGTATSEVEMEASDEETHQIFKRFRK